MLVKYKKPISQENLPKEEAKPKAEEQEEQEEQHKRKYTKIIFEGREDGGPKTRSKTARDVNKIQCKDSLEVNNEFTSLNVDQMNFFFLLSQKLSFNTIIVFVWSQYDGANIER